MRNFKLLFLCFFFIASAQAQTGYSAADVYLGLKKLNVLGSVLYVAAHPDDENTRLLTYFSKEKLYRTGYLSLTRGDGGQNLIGEEQGIELGLIRTQELLAARRIDGAEQFFSRAFDFGYSKTPEETFAKWNREKILSDVVWVIRKFRPDIIITRFPTTGEGGHGHHTGSAILANEAFEAAADPKRFPEQLQYVSTWQPKRILWNHFNPNASSLPEGIIRLDVGLYNPVLGRSYGEIAADSRSQHKSQGFGVPRSRGEAFEYFRNTGGPAPAADLMEGVSTGWERVPGGAAIQAMIDEAVQNFQFLQPQLSIPALVKIYRALQQLPSGYWTAQKLKETAQLIEAASGIWMESNAAVQNVVQGDSLRVTFVINNRLGTEARLRRIVIDGLDTSLQAPLQRNQNFVLAKTIPVADDKPVSQPYWLKERKEEGAFTVRDQQLIGQPDVTPSFTVHMDLEIDGTVFRFSKPLQYKYTDPVKGEQYQPVFVIPATTVYAQPEMLVFKKEGAQQREVTLHLGVNRAMAVDSLQVRLRSQHFAAARREKRTTWQKHQSPSFSFTLKDTDLGREAEDYLQPFANYREGEKEGAAYLALASINYDHIPSIRYFYSDGVKLLRMDLKTAGKRIGYIVGAGDKVPAALEQMGFEVVLLTEKEMERNNLSRFDAIISGVRAYNTNEWLNQYYDKLMKYVEAGGNLIVQYNTSNQIGPVKAKIGPFPFNITRTRITDENAPVQFLDPAHPVLNYPNRITQKDFEGWVQERSIYHAGGLAPALKPVLRMNDPGEGGDDGSLVIAPYGKGFFTYTGLVFFRQLPAGVPGAYRLMANLIALNQKKEF